MHCFSHIHKANYAGKVGNVKQNILNKSKTVFHPVQMQHNTVYLDAYIALVLLLTAFINKLQCR